MVRVGDNEKAAKFTVMIKDRRGDILKKKLRYEITQVISKEPNIILQF